MKEENNNAKLKIVWFFLKKYKISFMFVVGLAALAGILESITVGLMYPIINGVMNLDASSNTFLNVIKPYVNIIPIDDDLIRYCVVLLAVTLSVFVLKTLYYYFSAKLTARVVKETKQEVFSKCMKSDYQFFVDHKQGEILYKTAQAPNAVMLVLQIFSDVFLHLFLAISVIALLIFMSWKLIGILAIFGAIYFYMIKIISVKISYKTGIKQRESGQQERVILTEYAGGAKQIKVFETFDYWKDAFDKALTTFWIHHRKNYFWKKFPQTLLWMVLYTCIGISVIIIKILYPGKALMMLPLLGTFAAAILILLPKLSAFGSLRMGFMNAMPNVEAVYNVLKEERYSKIKNGSKKFISLKKGLFLRNVSFSHKERDILLDNINIEIKKNQTIALVGPSGSGKSTIVNLLLRLYDVEKGGIFIDDINIKEYDIFSYLEKIGFVSQDTFIFNGTIKENIAFGKDYSNQDIVESAKMANADDFIQKLPKKYDTLVGDHGMMLSGGENQRIAIARAMIRKPEILILDEATSSLDNVSENIVQKAIDKVSKNCTTFMIAHRLSTIQNADVIYVLDKGEIVESGSHKELLRKKGKYYELYNIQRHKDEKKGK